MFLIIETKKGRVGLNLDKVNTIIEHETRVEVRHTDGSTSFVPPNTLLWTQLQRPVYKKQGLEVTWHLMYICAHCNCPAETPLLDAEIVDDKKMILVCDGCGERTTVTSLHMATHEQDWPDRLCRCAVAFFRRKGG